MELWSVIYVHSSVLRYGRLRLLCQLLIRSGLSTFHTLGGLAESYCTGRLHIRSKTVAEGTNLILNILNRLKHFALELSDLGFPDPIINRSVRSIQCAQCFGTNQPRGP
ncbi:hypothetical protein RRG08_026176 [Elysia crispata]|uniref:Uncharacterized protein n=1 Tax=Elysia crispata TaxID=231223 RepID=A0AAE0ZAN5_9GAST|nr:hypothetical protein RRG08_026176 [Elysia crispata]